MHSVPLATSPIPPGTLLATLERLLWRYLDPTIGAPAAYRLAILHRVVNLIVQAQEVEARRLEVA
jgi:hypothetical protein